MYKKTKKKMEKKTEKKKMKKKISFFFFFFFPFFFFIFFSIFLYMDVANMYFDSGGSYYYHWMRDAGLSIKAWLDINDNDYDKSKDVLNAYVKWVNVVQHKPDPNDIDVRIGKKSNNYFCKCP